MTEYAVAKPNDRAGIIDFVNMVFSMDHRPHDFKKDLPKVYADGAPWYDRAIHFVARDGETILGNVALLPLDLYVNGKTLKTGFIGAVSTHPYHRGIGAMKTLMKMAEDYARTHGFDMLELGGQRQRYEYYGYKQMGLRRKFEVSKTNVRHVLGNVNADDISVYEVTENDSALLNEIHALHNALPIHVERPREAFLSIMHSWRGSLLAIKRDDTLIGYTVFQGLDDTYSELILRDYSDTSAALKALIGKQEHKEFTFTAFSFQKDSIKALGKIAEGWNISFEMMVNILNPENFYEVYPQKSDDNAELPCALDFPGADMF
ncbi:MAG: GNAT family N-acetyltransferase [Oscillospiraceae bacterium]|jgi:predicted acetyltransferase|nr:GNAT family N-acetyltransferase [Oscillospiraceae bacterium]